MDIYLFTFIIFAFGSLVVTILVMYGQSHNLQDELRELDEEYSHAVNSLDFKTQRLVALEDTEKQLRSDLKSTENIWKARYQARTNRLNNAKDEIKNLEREVRKLQHERLACVTCTPTLKKKA